MCTTQVGFPGARAYEKTPGTHQVLLLENDHDKGYITSSKDLPEGWSIKEDSNFQDNSELAPVQLIACSKRVKETPTGKQCDFDNDGTKVTLELADSTYDLKVYAATTGKEVGASTLEGKSADCPYIAVFNKGDTTYVSEPSEDDYTNALKPYVVP